MPDRKTLDEQCQSTVKLADDVLKELPRAIEYLLWLRKEALSSIDLNRLSEIHDQISEVYYFTVLVEDRQSGIKPGDSK